MIPPPPRSTLFPYTTLFRSYRAHQLEGLRRLSPDHILGLEEAVDHLDRKSTRLNSSHGYISYAVFCLKKKKKNNKIKHSYSVLDTNPHHTLHLSHLHSDDCA